MFWEYNNDLFLTVYYIQSCCIKLIFLPVAILTLGSSRCIDPRGITIISVCPSVCLSCQKDFGPPYYKAVVTLTYFAQVSWSNWSVTVLLLWLVIVTLLEKTRSLVYCCQKKQKLVETPWAVCNEGSSAVCGGAITNHFTHLLYTREIILLSIVYLAMLIMIRDLSQRAKMVILNDYVYCIISDWY